MVEGFPTSGLQLMTRVGDFFRVARTEVVQVPAVLPGTHATPVRAVLQVPWPWEIGVSERMVHPLPSHRLPEGMGLC